MDVQKGADIFASAEESARKIKAEMRLVRDVIKGVRDAGHIGGLEYEDLSCEADAIGTKFEADMYAFHSKITNRCKELNIDLPQLRGGDR